MENNVENTTENKGKSTKFYTYSIIIILAVLGLLAYTLNYGLNKIASFGNAKNNTEVTSNDSLKIDSIKVFTVKTVKTDSVKVETTKEVTKK